MKSVRSYLTFGLAVMASLTALVTVAPATPAWASTSKPVCGTQRGSSYRGKWYVTACIQAMPHGLKFFWKTNIQGFLSGYGEGVEFVGNVKGRSNGVMVETFFHCSNNRMAMSCNSFFTEPKGTYTGGAYLVYGDQVRFILSVPW